MTADPTVPDNRRGESLIEYLTGIDVISEQRKDENARIVFEDSNYGGVWGDTTGGWVVAVLDCSLVDPDRVAAIAGGAAAVRLIRVPYTFEEIYGFRNKLIDEARSLGVEADVQIDSTLSGRMIRVIVPDPGRLGSEFGASTPTDVFEIEAGELSQDM